MVIFDTDVFHALEASPATDTVLSSAQFIRLAEGTAASDPPPLWIQMFSSEAQRREVLGHFLPITVDQPPIDYSQDPVVLRASGTNPKRGALLTTTCPLQSEVLERLEADSCPTSAPSVGSTAPAPHPAKAQDAPDDPATLPFCMRLEASGAPLFDFFLSELKPEEIRNAYVPNGTWTTPICIERHGSNTSPIIQPIFAYSKQSGSRHRKRPHHNKYPHFSTKVVAVKSKCLGAYVCANSDCFGIDRPKGTSSVESRSNTVPAGDGPKRHTHSTCTAHSLRRECDICHGPLMHKTCEAYTLVAQLDDSDLTAAELADPNFDGSKFRNLWHVGNHGHRPPPANAPNPAAARAYAATLRYRTSIHPAVLRQGYDVLDPQSPTNQRPAFEWDPRWVSLTKLRRDMDKFYGRPDSSPDLDAAGPDSANTAPIWIALQGLVRIQPQYLAYQTADKKGDLLSFGIQTPEMRAWAVDDQSFAQEMGRGGIPTDAHNSFFTDGLILITSVVLHPLLERWVPILHSIGRSEDSEIYWAHFDHIYQLADRTGKSTIDALRDFKLVLDFSAAQGSSFKHAFADWYVRRQVSVKGSDNVTVEGRVELRQEGLNLAQEQMIGCLQHYKASVNRHSTLRFLRNDTGADTETLQDLQHEFATMAWSLTKARTPRTAAAIAESITKRWPMLRHWGTFWTLPRILPMINRALSKMTPEERRLYPTTTNAVESAHKCLIHASASNNNKPAKGVHRVLDSVQFFIGLQVVAKTGNFTGSRLRSKGNDEDEKQVTPAARAVEKRKQVPRSYVPSGRPLDPFEAENRRPISHKAFMDKALLDSDDDDITIVEAAVNAEYQNSPPLELVNDIIVEAAAEVERSSAPLENAGIPDPPSTNTTVEEEPRGTAAPPLGKAKGFVRTAPRRARNYSIKPVDPAAVVSGVRSSTNAPLASSTVKSQVHSMVNTSLLLVSRVTGTLFGTFAPDTVGVLQTSNNQNSCWLDSALMAMMASWDALNGFLVSLEEPLRSHTNEGSTAESSIVEVYNALRDFFRTYAGTIDDKASMTTAATRIDRSRDELRRLITANLLAPGHGDHRTTGYANAVEWWQYLASSLFKLSKATLPPQSTRMAETDWIGRIYKRVGCFNVSHNYVLCLRKGVLA